MVIFHSYGSTPQRVIIVMMTVAMTIDQPMVTEGIHPNYSQASGDVGSRRSYFPWVSHHGDVNGPGSHGRTPCLEHICFMVHHHVHDKCTFNMIWVWVKIRYPNNWMVNTKLD